ncbi:MAG: response regulator [Deltaproteobacteria bacterium]|nr:response regulator [Deltaproteobacteria bacterium]
MENIFSYSMEEKGLDFSVEIDQQLPPDLQTDQQRLEQMLKNLLSNALKFTQTGSVTLAMKKPAADMDLSVSGLCPEESSAFSVIDTGIGVSESNQLEIFEAFQQADGTTSRQYGGTGLGLSITREFVKLMGGEIQLDSREGHGSTFTIFLPQEAVGGTSTLKERLPDSSAAKVSAAGMLDSAYSRSIPDDRERLDKNDKVVLMIEDDMQFAKVLYEVCREKGFKCIHAAAGEKGINMAEAYRPHAIILDLSLPGISGWQVLDMLKDNIHTRHIPVHIISASEKTVDALMKGAVGYLTKPVSEDQLEDVLGRLDKMISKETKDLLIVEDDTDLRDGIQGLFDSDAISITATGSGREALGLIRQKQFDCVILDLRLPDITGFEVLKEISAIDGYPAPPVVIYTGTELSDAEQLELSKYADSVIIKGAKSDERLVAETTLFLHTVTDDLHGAGRGRMEELQNVDGFIKGKKVLTVDDDMRNLFALTEELEELGMVVVKATNGREALAVLEKDADIDIVLMDIMMPVMDGYEAMRNIRQQPGLEDLPILALTAKAMREDRSKCIEAGANDYIPKPVDMERLLSTMRVWLKK